MARKHRLRNFLKKEKSRFQKIKEKIHETLKKTHFPNKEERKYMALLPMKHVMKKALDKKGIQHTNKLPDIAQKFMTHFVGQRAKVSSHLSGSHFVESDLAMFEENFYYDGVDDYFDFESSDFDSEDFNADGDDDGGGDSGSGAGAYIDTAKKAGGIIKRILAWFKERKAKRKAKQLAEQGQTPEAIAKAVPDLQPNTPAIQPHEEEILDDHEAAQSVIVKAAEKEVDKDDAKKEAGFLGTGFSPITIIVTLAVVTIGLKLLFGEHKAGK